MLGEGDGGFQGVRDDKDTVLVGGPGDLLPVWPSCWKWERQQKRHMAAVMRKRAGAVVEVCSEGPSLRKKNGEGQKGTREKE